MRKITSIFLILYALSFVGCNGGGGGAAGSSSSSTGTGPVAATLPPAPANNSPVNHEQGDEDSLVPDPGTNNFIRLNSRDEGSNNTIVLQGASD